MRCEKWGSGASDVIRENYQNMAETGKKLVTNKFLHQCVLLGVLVGEKKTAKTYLPGGLLQSLLKLGTWNRDIRKLKIGILAHISAS